MTRITCIVLALTACRTPDAADLTGSWTGHATPSGGDFLPGGADVTANLTETENGAYFGEITFRSDLGPQVFDIGAELPGNRIEFSGKDETDVIAVGLLLDVKSDQNSMDGTWTMIEIGCEDCTGNGSIGLDR